MSGSCFRTLAVILVFRLMQMIISVAMYKQSNPIGFRKEKKKGITKKQKKTKKNEAKKRGNMLNWPSHWLALVGPVQQTTYGMHDCSQGCTLDKEPKELAMRVREKNTNTEFAHLSTHTVYRHKIQFLRYFRGIWPYWKMDTGKHNFHEILLLF